MDIHVLFIVPQTTGSFCNGSEVRLGSNFFGYRSWFFAILIYINDISNGIKSEIRRFANDYACYREIKAIEDIVKLQNNKEGKDQESIQSSTTPDLGYQWKS